MCFRKLKVLSVPSKTFLVPVDMNSRNGYYLYSYKNNCSRLRTYVGVHGSARIQIEIEMFKKINESLVNC